MTDYINFILIPRIWVGIAFCALGIILLKTFKVSRSIRLISLFIIFLMFAIVPILPLGWFATGVSMHPSPMCAATKPVLFYVHRGFIPSIFLLILAYIGIVSLIGNKLFCGWTCPLGALQEIAHFFKLPKGWKKVIPFTISNTIRVGIFVVFLILIFLGGMSIYSYLNPFEFFHWHFALYTSVVMLFTLAVSVFIFRPFCYLICPIGLLTWLIESFSIIKLKVNKDVCNGCKLCIKKSNCPAVGAIVNGKKIRPDCHLCGRCIDKCPEKAFEFTR